VLRLTRRELAALVFLTLFWGLNWPIMKSAVSDYPPFAFRAWSMLLGLPCLALGLVALRVPFRIARRHWPELVLAVTNMVVWHVFLMLALPSLSSGRAAILGYTMPVFSALWGLTLFGERLTLRQVLGVGAAGLGIVLLLRHEFHRLSGAPIAAATLLFGTAIWALGTQQLRRTRIQAPTLAIVFWMTAITTAVVCLLSSTWEASTWRMPSATTLRAIVYNAVLIFGFCHAAWFVLARSLPPVASSISICLIPVLGLLSGALMLGEVLHWQDGVAIGLIVLAIATVLLPARSPRAEPMTGGNPNPAS
jgi:drug/metabolite transporter (DMT)-like permease